MKATISYITLAFCLLIFAPTVKSQSKIWNGDDAVAGAQPWVVPLLRSGVADNYDAQFCGGSLVDPEWVLTAAHCVEGELASDIQVGIGMHDLSSGGTRVGVTNIFIHPNYFVDSDGNLHNDVALLRLANPVTSVIPVRLADGTTPLLPGTPATIFGWGAQGAGLAATFPNILQETTVNLTTLSAASGHGSNLDQSMLAATSATADSCGGDSGGPVVVVDNDGDFSLVGVVSFGFECSTTSVPGIYAHVLNLKPWIEGLIDPSTPNPPLSVPILNLSTRGYVGTGDEVLIGGITIQGDGVKRIRIMGRGLSLSDTVPNRLTNPSMTIHSSDGGVIASSKDWASEPLAGEISASVGSEATHALDAGLQLYLTEGAYTAIIKGENGETGIGMVEFFDESPTSNARIVNLSTRGLVGTGDNVLIGGTVVGGVSPNQVRVIFRARGSSIPFTVPNRLSDPTMRLFYGGQLNGTYDDWGSDPDGATIQANYSILAPQSGLDSASIEDLPAANSYTAIVEGYQGATGIGIVELFVNP